MRATDQSVRFTHSADGTRIAFAVSGSGPGVLLCMGAVGSHLLETARDPSLRMQFERLAASHTLVRWDPRGSGLSQRGITSYLPGDVVADMLAVLDAASVARCDVIAGTRMESFAVHLATAHPERVRSLSLIDPLPQFQSRPSVRRSLEVLREEDWVTFTETIMQLVSGLSHDGAKRLAAFNRKTVDQEDFQVIFRGLNDSSVEDLLPVVSCPVLIIATSDQRHTVLSGAPNGAQQVAALVPNPTLASCSGRPLTPGLDPGDWLDAVVAFLAAQRPRQAPPTSQLSDREQEVLRLLAAGRSNGRVA